MMNKDKKSLLWGLAAGSVLGSVTALLLAPKAGKELRKDIADGTAHAAEKVQELAGQVGEKSSEWAAKAKETTLSAISGIREWGRPAGDAPEEQALVSGLEDSAPDAETSIKADGTQEEQL